VVVAATPVQVARFLGWKAAEVRQTAAQLEEAGLIRTDVAIEGMAGEYMVHSAEPAYA